MKIIILRHGCRFKSPLYFTPLNDKGLKQADELIDILKAYDIDTIYASPFLRVIQTIYPYCIDTNKKINIENTFYESLDSEEFNYYNYRHGTNELKTTYPYLLKIINERYSSDLFASNISYIETERLLMNRVYPFIYNMIMRYKATEKIFLIVTHGAICNTIKKYFNNDIKLNAEFPEGTLEVINVPKDIKGPASFNKVKDISHNYQL